MGRMDAEWIIFNGKLKRSMWPLETCEWVAEQLCVAPPGGGSSLTWLALTLERQPDPEKAAKRLLAALDDAPEGTFTDEDWAQEHRAEAAAYDRYVNDRAEGHGRREGNQQ